MLESSSSAAVYTLLSTIIYLKAVKYLNIRMRKIHQTDMELKIKVRNVADPVLYYNCND